MAVEAAAAWYEELREVEYRQESTIKKMGSISKKLMMASDLSEAEVAKLREERTVLREEVQRLALEMSPRPDFSRMTEAERAAAAERLRSVEVNYARRLTQEGDSRGQAMEASARIVDFDPKQGGRYYSRYTRGDLTKFDLDEECKSLACALAFHSIPSFCMFCHPPVAVQSSTCSSGSGNYYLCYNRYVTMC
jgi:hypothetical protein